VRERSVSGTISREKPLFGRLVGGRYRVRSFLGAGPIGAVYLAHQASQSRSVVVKSVHAALAEREGFSEAFLREVKAASFVDHPAFVKVLDYGQEPDRTLFVVTEHVEGRPLAEVIAEGGPLPEARVVEIVSEVLRALVVAHGKGFVHRGLTPSNLFLPAGPGPSPAVVVTDFGVSSLRQLPVAGLGAAPYSAPEQTRSDRADKRSDLYALGVILYEMLTGRFPAVGSPSEGAPHAAAQVPSCSKRLADVAFRAMQLSPAARFPSARAMLDAVLGRGTGRDETTAMPAEPDDGEIVDEAELVDAGAPTAAPPPDPSRGRAELPDATYLDLVAMPSFPERTLQMAAMPEASSPAFPSPAPILEVSPWPAERSGASLSPVHHGEGTAPVSPPVPSRRVDWIPYAQGAAVFVVCTVLGLLVLFALLD